MALRLILLAVVLATALGLQTGSAAAAAPPTQWCGRDLVTTDRPDTLTGAQIHVIYATPSDGEDRFGALASAITTDLAWIDAWWRREDPLRAPRFDLFPFAACPGGVAAMDISSIRLAQPSAYYAPFATRFGRLATDLGGSPYGHAHPAKKYLVYYDGALDTSPACGQGQPSARLGGFVGYAMLFLRCPFGPVLGTGSSGAIIAVHELVHAFGAVPRETPGATTTTPTGARGGTCRIRSGSSGWTEVVSRSRWPSPVGREWSRAICRALPAALRARRTGSREPS